MGVNILDSSASVSETALKARPAVNGGLVYMALPGGDFSKTSRNYRVDQSDGFVNGVPVLDDGFATFLPNASSVTTTASDGDNLTIMVAVRVNEDDGSNILGNYQSPRVGNPSETTNGILLRATYYAGEGIRFQFGASDWEGTGGSFNRFINSPENRVVGNWYFIAVTVSDTQNTFRNLTESELRVSNVPAGRIRDVGSATFRFGGSYNNLSGWRGSNSIAFSAFYDRILSNQEIEDMYSWAKLRLAVKGITV